MASNPVSWVQQNNISDDSESTSDEDSNYDPTPTMFESSSTSSSSSSFVSSGSQLLPIGYNAHDEESSSSSSQIMEMTLNQDEDDDADSESTSSSSQIVAMTLNRDAEDDEDSGSSSSSSQLLPMDFEEVAAKQPLQLYPFGAWGALRGSVASHHALSFARRRQLAYGRHLAQAWRAPCALHSQLRIKNIWQRWWADVLCDPPNPNENIRAVSILHAPHLPEREYSNQLDYGEEGVINTGQAHEIGALDLPDILDIIARWSHRSYLHSDIQHHIVCYYFNDIEWMHTMETTFDIVRSLCITIHVIDRTEHLVDFRREITREYLVEILERLQQSKVDLNHKIISFESFITQNF